MRRQWIARVYRYADGLPYNEDRYEIFVWHETGDWVSVGGAIRNWKQETIAFLCTKATNRKIRTQQDAENMAEGGLVWGSSVKEALVELKRVYPNPIGLLEHLRALEDATF